MNDIVTARKNPSTSLLRRFLVLILILMASGAAAGVVWANSEPRIYTAESRLAVTGRGLTSEEIGGFPLASQELAADYARYVNNAEEQSSLEEDLGITEGSVTEVAASPIPESNVIRVEVSAKEKSAARAATRHVSDALIARINDTSAQSAAAEEVLAQLTTLSTQAADAQQASRAAQSAVDNAQGRAESGFPRRGDDLNALRAAAAAATAQYNLLEAQRVALQERYQKLITEQGTPATLEVVMPTTYRGDDFRLQALRYGLLGMAVGGALAVALVKYLDLRSRRRAVRQEQPKPERELEPPVSPPHAGHDVRPLTEAGARPGS